METCNGGAMIHLHGGSLNLQRIRSRRLFAGRRRAYAGLREDGGFSDDGHLRYYARCEGMATGEKRTKLIKKLSKDLEALVRIGDEYKEGFVGVGETIANEGAAENLLAELVKMRTEEKMKKKERQKEKALKKMRKEEEKAMKKMKKKDEEKAMNNMKKKKSMTCVREEDTSSSSSSESSDSSDSECERVVGISSLRAGKPIDQANPVQICDDAMDSSGSVSGSRCSNCTTNDNVIVHSQVSAAALTGEAQPANKIEVCVGGKCRKSGALQLMEEFSKVVGNDGVVVGCKCMGKCKAGPNVRVLSHLNEDDVSVPLPRNPLCIGVGLEDVQVIVSNYLRRKNGMGLLSA